MILYDLKCANDHSFEAWFRNSETCDKQLRKKTVACPACGDTAVGKAMMAPNIISKSTESKSKPELPAQALEAMKKLRQHVEENCEYVGDRFPDEARKIHYEEADERGIYGEASLEEAIELHEEGIGVTPVPGTKRPPKRTN